MNKKHFLISSFILLFFAFSFLKVEGQAPNFTPGTMPICMKTNNLNINTGYNHRLNQWYASNQRDGYWSLTSAEGVNVPMCAFVWSEWCKGGSDWGPLTNCRFITCVAENSGIDPNVNATAVGCNLKSGTNVFTFRRSFWVDLPTTTNITGILNMTIVWDDRVNDVRVNGTSTGISTGCATGTNNSSLPVTLHGGQNFIDIDIWNRQFSLNSNTSPMGIKVQANITTVSGNQDIVSNYYYMPNTTDNNQSWACNAPLVNIYKPEFVGQCIPSGATSGVVTITNYFTAPNIQCTINPSVPISPTGTFVGTLNSTYTVTVSDPIGGCPATNSVKIVPNNLQVTYTPTTLPCITPGLKTPINFTNATGGTAPYLWSCPTVFNSLGTGSIGQTDKVLFSGAQAPVGNHFFTIKDANGCSTTKNIKVGNLFTITNNATPPCIKPGKITVNYSPSNIISYQTFPMLYYLNGGGVYSSNILDIGTNGVLSTAGIYTVNAVDNYGCTASSTRQMYPNPVVSATYTNTCPPTFTATSNIPANLVWTNAQTTNSLFFSPTSGSITTPFPCYNSINTPFTVTATDAHGCVGSYTGSFTSNPFCCDCFSQCSTMVNYPTAWSQTNNKKFSSRLNYSNCNSSALLAAFGNPANNVITTNDQILIDGEMLINQNVTFLNCPNVLFTQGAKIKVTNNATLTIDNSKMRSLCHIHWEGIIATGNGTNSLTSNPKLIIKNSEFKDMLNGVQANSGAVLDCDNNKFINNGIGIQISSSPNGYNYVNGNCKIINNYFIKELFPCGSMALTGIRVKDCKEVAIGVLDYATKTNFFKDIVQGIYITSTLPNQTENYYIYDNQFENLTKYGIYSDCVPTTIARHTLFVKNTYENVNNAPIFLNCNNSVYTKYVSANIQETQSLNCNNGFIFENALNQSYTILGNFITGNTLTGMAFNGNTNSHSLVENNIIQLRSTPVNNIFPTGIRVNFNAPNSTNGITFNYNTVEIRANAGSGFSLLNTNANTLLYINTVNNTNPTPSPFNNGGTNFGNASSAHYDITNCNGTKLIENRSNGSNQLLTGGVNNVEGMRITSSVSCEFSCNRFNKTRIGTMVVGNCLGTTFRGNRYNCHGNSLRFQDIGGGASIGDIGSFTDDNNNQFTSGSLFSTPFNFTLFRFSTNSAFSSSIFTNLSITSGSNLTGNSGKYIITTPGGSASLYTQCLDTSFITSVGTNGSPYTETDAVEIANETGQYAEFSEVAKYIEDGRLFCEIADGDLNLLNNPTIADFYADQQLTFRDELYMVDKMIEGLSDSSFAEDSTKTFEEKVLPIETLNNSIVSNNDLEKDEQFINKLYLQWLKGGIEMIDSTDSIELEIIAWSCPMEKGTAVYKARSIYSSINPSATFDDIALCVEGLNKYATEQEATIDINLLNNVLADEIKVYPNPANEEVTIDYVLPENTQGKITIFDMLGRARITLDLSATNNRVKLSVANLEKGVYLYKYLVNNKVVKADKLIIK